MRYAQSSPGLNLCVLTGTHVVMLTFDRPESACKGLMGFAIHRTDHTEGEAYWLQGMKTFAATDPGRPPGTLFSTREQPVQDFSWSDYTAKPGHRYTYRVLALSGTPEQLDIAAEIAVTVETESPAGGDHDINFNRGVAGSQEYARRFGNRRPGSVRGERDPAWAWLSRGAFEAIRDFIRRAKSPSWGLLVCGYELQEMRVLREFKRALERGVSLRIVHDADAKNPGPQNAAAMRAAGIPDEVVVARKTSAISHNKVIVLLHKGLPAAVLTGSTNITSGGIFGHSNVVHVVEQAAVASQYRDYIDALALNPKPAVLKKTLDQHPLEMAAASATATVFSPRSKPDALALYAGLAKQAKDALFITFAFGMNAAFEPAFESGDAGLRYALFEKLLGPNVKKEDRPAAEARMLQLRRKVENRFAVGAYLRGNAFDGWLAEEPTGENSHVRFVHTKYMLIDPLGNDPLVISGSANFSLASCTSNDENMLLIRGNARVADIYLTEFLRLWEHYAFREWASSRSAEEIKAPWHLDSGNTWWHRYFGNTAHSRHRRYFLRPLAASTNRSVGDDPS